MYSSESTLEAAIEALRGVLASAPAKLLALSEPQASTRPDHRLTSGGWSRKQILGHLLDSAANNHHRFVRAQFEPNFAMPAYAQEAWVDAGRYTQRRWTELVQFWTVYNRHLLHLMETAPREYLSRLCRIGADDPVTLEFIMVDYVGHLEHHLQQILA
jgi:hypothetical protein